MSKRIRERYKSEVDIVTAVYGSLDFVKDTAQTLLKDHDAGINFRWILVDDDTPIERGSKELIKYLKELESSDERVTFIQNKVNKGFSGANNIGFSKCTADYVVMLNSDIKIKQDGWLRELIKPMKDNSTIGVVGAKLLFFEDSKDRNRPAGMVQHAGVVFNVLKQPYHIFMGWSPDHTKVNESRVMRAVTGACLATRRNILRGMGGLAEIYTKGNFEDVEYCIRTSTRGFAVLYNPLVELYHYGSGSNNTETAVRNQQIFQIRNSGSVSWDDYRFY